MILHLDETPVFQGAQLRFGSLVRITVPGFSSSVPEGDLDVFYLLTVVPWGVTLAAWMRTTSAEPWGGFLASLNLLVLFSV